MATVTITDILTRTSVQLDQRRADLVAAEIETVRPNRVERLLMRFFPGPDAYPKIAPDYEITVDDGGRRVTYELLSETVLQRADNRLAFNFLLGTQIVAWHGAQVAAPSP